MKLYSTSVIACVGNLCQMSLKLFDSLMIGNTFVAYQGFIIFLDFFAFNYRIGRLIGVNEQLNKKFPFTKLIGDDGYINPSSRASNFGLHTLLSLIGPLFSSFLILDLQLN